MVIDFTIENFRSIKSETTLSLFAEKSKDVLANNIRYPDGKTPTLGVAGIYGPNASGKSNILLAFEALRYIANETGNLKQDEIIKSYEPFRLCESTIDQPTKFEIEFVIEEIRYIYKVAYTNKRIVEESLDFYPSRARANLFRREENDTWEEISFGGLYKGGKKKYPLFSNNSYLAKAGNSADSPELIRKVYSFFRAGMFHVGIGETISIIDWKKCKSTVNSVAAFLGKIDTGINGLSFRDDLKGRNLRLPDNFPEDLKERFLEDFSQRPYFEHLTETGESISFDEGNESAGTKRIFAMLPILLDVFKRGSVLIWDEFESSLHPHVAELIIKLFNDPRVNSRNAQLIFSTHNLQLMNCKFLRKDQIWLTEKENGTTLLVSLDEFRNGALKSSSPFAKWYDEGRLGGTPDIDYLGIAKIFYSENETRDGYAKAKKEIN